MSKPKIAIVFYSTYMHVYKLALAIKEGAEKVGEVEVSIYQVKETLPQEVLEKMSAPPKPEVPEITPSILTEVDGILFGFPTRYGTMCGQMKEFLDSCGQLWMKNSLQNKFCGCFISTASQHGGQETTIMTFMSIIAHFGLFYVPLGYQAKNLQNNDKVLGGSPWGASVIAGGDGSRVPSEEELENGVVQGEHFASTVFKYWRGSNHQETKKDNDGVPVSSTQVPKETSNDKTGQTVDPAASKDTNTTAKSKSSTTSFKKMFQRLSVRGKPKELEQQKK